MTRPQLDLILPVRGRAGRDGALAVLEARRAALIFKLRNAAAAVWRATGQPVSVNDIRHILDEEAYTGDPRVLGAVFHCREWVPIGADTTNSRRANSRPIRTFVPRDP